MQRRYKEPDAKRSGASGQVLPTNLDIMKKISMDELRRRFDVDVDRFSDERNGQRTAVDAALVLDMLERLIARMHPGAKDLCDIGCGAGNFALRIARTLPGLELTLLDLSEPMLRRAAQRLEAERFRVKETIRDDIRNVCFQPEMFDIVVAAASLHHLRSREDWSSVFQNVFDALRPGGSFWICDIIRHEIDEVEAVQRERYAEFLIALQDRAFQEEIFEMIERSDSPETIDFQIRTLHDAGFRKIDVVHKNMIFCVLVARKVACNG